MLKCTCPLPLLYSWKNLIIIYFFFCLVWLKTSWPKKKRKKPTHFCKLGFKWMAFVIHIRPFSLNWIYSCYFVPSAVRASPQQPPGLEENRSVLTVDEINCDVHTKASAPLFQPGSESPGQERRVHQDCLRGSSHPTPPQPSPAPPSTPKQLHAGVTAPLPNCYFGTPLSVRTNRMGLIGL